MTFLYSLGILLYGLGIQLASLWNRKAKLWMQGRAAWRARLSDDVARLSSGKRIWIHCASLGEYEQGRPIIDALRAGDRSLKIILTFFSPSGYESVKDKAAADVVIYLPLDGKKAARDFVSIVIPSAAVFVKYEFWYHYLHTLHAAGIPVILAAGAFRDEHVFFKKRGGFFRRMLFFFDHFFLQDEHSKNLLLSAGIGPAKVSVSGDTRYDRVVEIAAAPQIFPSIEKFLRGGKAIVAGSTWPADETFLNGILPHVPDDVRLIIAPHEIHAGRIAGIERLFEGQTVRYSRLATENSGRRILIVDNIGMLSLIYRYGAVAWVGGGFNKGGIHNVLEPAAYGLPVLFGPVYNKFVEAVELSRNGLVFPVNDSQNAAVVYSTFISDEQKRSQHKARMLEFVHSRRGAAEKIAGYILEKIRG